MPQDFNSRPSARGDSTNDFVTFLCVYISIHAPPRGATAATRKRRDGDTFQFTPLREGRRDAQAPPRKEGIFQFTPLREGRHGRWALLPLHLHFNSRPSARGDFVAFRQRLPCKFQFTPLREGRLLWLFDNVCPANFNSRPSARGDGESFSCLLWLFISIHAPPRGATSSAATRMSAASTFQFTPLREGRPCVPRRADGACAFQFTPLREGRRPEYRPNPQELLYFNSRPSARGDPAPARQTTRGPYFNSRPSARGDR